MYNIVTRKDFTIANIPSRIIHQALGCCLLKLGTGVYSVIRTCREPRHHRFSTFIDDTSWIDVHSQRSADDLAADPRYAEQLGRLRIVSYPNYREHDVIWGISAALLHGIPLFGVPRRNPISVIHPSSNSRSALIVRSKRPISEADLVDINGLRMSTRIRTSFELTRQMDQRSGFAALEWTLRRSLLGPTDPEWLKYGYPDDFVPLGRRRVVDEFAPVVDRLSIGRTTAGRMLEAIDPRSEALSESYCSFDLRALGLTAFDQQVKICDSAGFIARVDFIDHTTRTIVEVDGIEKSVRGGRRQISRQSYQHNRLLALGYTVVRFRFSELLNLHTFATKLFAQAPRLRSSITS